MALVTAPRIGPRWQDIETAPIQDALTQLGITSETTPWYEERDWAKYELIVVRSPWDYYWHLDDFLAWTNSMREYPLLNTSKTILWNINKHYLEELSKAGIPTVDTQFLKPQETVTLPDIDFVVKPVISEGALNTARYRADQKSAASEHIEKLHADNIELMIQPYMTNVDQNGERSLLFYNKKLDHSSLKQAVLKAGEPFDVERESHPDPVPYQPTKEELDLAHTTLEAIPFNDPLLYARVDIALGENGDPILMELELLDPVLFLAQSEGSAHRYAQAIAAHL